MLGQSKGEVILHAVCLPKVVVRRVRHYTIHHLGCRSFSLHLMRWQKETFHREMMKYTFVFDQASGECVDVFLYSSLKYING